MPYLLLVIGALLGLYAFYRFFLVANVQQIKALFLSMALLVLGAALFFMAVTGRLPAALALLVAMAPVANALFRQWRPVEKSAPAAAPTSEISSRAEALAVLGLKEDAQEEEIQLAYKKLMQKFHPDREGSQWMASRLNQARDILLGKNH
ncbi:MAG: DnaJ domain-containing protein [Alphaproteobacteria bacterium]|nr:DnaJ domain-containing protein [Alphaproteobacteria bacterium]